MGDDSIRYFLFLNGRWRWRPTKAMRARGFRLKTFGPGTVVDGQRVSSAEDSAAAVALNQEWDAVRRGRAFAPADRNFPIGSIGDGYERALRLRASEREAKGIVWTKEQESRDDWPRAWKWIEPFFGAADPRTVTPEQWIGDSERKTEGLMQIITREVSKSEAHRIVKIWRALWKKMALFKYCDKNLDPTMTFANSGPDGRSEVWFEGEVVRFAKRAWRMKYFGLAAVLATAWETEMSPIDVRKLTGGMRAGDGKGTVFFKGRAKTGAPAIGALGARATVVLDAYLKQLGIELHDDAPIFRNRSGDPYSKDTLGDDFRAVREIEFPGDKRQLRDIRRSAAVEAKAGEATDEEIGAGLANAYAKNPKLRNTYTPRQVVNIKTAKPKRLLGRSRLRE